MQQAADFITADFLYMFRATCAHHQEYKICIFLHHVGVLFNLKKIKSIESNAAHQPTPR